jgi:hypothetical protein
MTRTTKWTDDMINTFKAKIALAGGAIVRGRVTMNTKENNKFKK